MTKDELRKHVIGCNTLEEMKAVWETLRNIGEKTYRKTFNYAIRRDLNFKFYDDDGDWVHSLRPPTLSYQEFMVEFGSKPGIDRKFLRKQIIGPFATLEEMREAWELLKAIGEVMARKTFNYPIHNKLAFDCYDWIAYSSELHTMTLQELKIFLSAQEKADCQYLPQCSPAHDCTLYWSVVQNCCLKCHPERDPRNTTKLWGLLDEEKRHQELIAQVKRGKRHV